MLRKIKGVGDVLRGISSDSSCPPILKEPLIVILAPSIARLRVGSSFVMAAVKFPCRGDVGGQWTRSVHHEQIH